MTYPYGLRGAPAVGLGIPGLPQRQHVSEASGSGGTSDAGDGAFDLISPSNPRVVNGLVSGNSELGYMVAGADGTNQITGSGEIFAFYDTDLNEVRRVLLKSSRTTSSYWNFRYTSSYILLYVQSSGEICVLDHDFNVIFALTGFTYCFGIAEGKDGEVIVLHTRRANTTYEVIVVTRIDRAGNPIQSLELPFTFQIHGTSTMASGVEGVVYDQNANTLIAFLRVKPAYFRNLIIGFDFNNKRAYSVYHSYETGNVTASNFNRSNAVYLNGYVYGVTSDINGGCYLWEVKSDLTSFRRASISTGYSPKGVSIAYDEESNAFCGVIVDNNNTNYGLTFFSAPIQPQGGSWAVDVYRTNYVASNITFTSPVIGLTIRKKPYIQARNMYGKLRISGDALPPNFNYLHTLHPLTHYTKSFSNSVSPGESALTQIQVPELTSTNFGFTVVADEYPLAQRHFEGGLTRSAEFEYPTCGLIAYSHRDVV